MAKSLLFFYSIIGIACGLTRSATKAQNQHEKIAMEKFGIGTEFFYNEPRTYVICAKITPSTPTNPQHTVRFLIFDIAAGQVIFEDTMADGEARWIDSTRIQVTKRFGIVTKSGEGGFQSYVYDVVTQSKVDVVTNGISTD
jgi:hypothetical protein